MNKRPHSNLSKEEYLSRLMQKPPPDILLPELSAFMGCAAFTIAGIAHCLQTQMQMDVRKGMAVRFELFSSTCDALSLKEQCEIILAAPHDCIALLLYTVCVSPQFGTCAALDAVLDGVPAAGGSAFAQSSYQIGSEMTLTAHTAVRLFQTRPQVLQLVNRDSTADINHASLLLVLLNGTPPFGFNA